MDIADRPLSIIDVTFHHAAEHTHPRVADHWYWCRVHKRPEHVGWVMTGCLRIGPFMTEREAQRLKGAAHCIGGLNALGMETEQ